MLSKKLSALVAISVLTASSAAVAQSAQPLSLANAPAARAGAPTADANALDGRNGIGIYIIGAVVLGLIIWGIIELTKTTTAREPVSRRGSSGLKAPRSPGAFFFAARKKSIA